MFKIILIVEIFSIYCLGVIGHGFCNYPASRNDCYGGRGRVRPQHCLKLRQEMEDLNLWSNSVWWDPPMVRTRLVSQSITFMTNQLSEIGCSGDNPFFRGLNVDSLSWPRTRISDKPGRPLMVTVEYCVQVWHQENFFAFFIRSHNSSKLDYIGRQDAPFQRGSSFNCPVPSFAASWVFDVIIPPIYRGRDFVLVTAWVSVNTIEIFLSCSDIVAVISL